MFQYPMTMALVAYRHVKNLCEIPVGWYDEDGIFQAYDLAGRTLVFKVRSTDAAGAREVIDSSADASTCAPKSGATDVVEIAIPSDLATTTPAGSYEAAIVDTTDAATDGEVLIAVGTFEMREQAVW